MDSDITMGAGMDLVERCTVHGVLAVRLYKDGVLLDRFTDKNLLVDASKTALAALLGGDGAGRTITRFGVGTNGTAPDPADTALTAPFVKDVDSVSYPAAGQVRFAWSLANAEANGMMIREFGLICSDGTLFSRKTRGAIEKESDMSLDGTWTISFT